MKNNQRTLEEDLAFNEYELTHWKEMAEKYGCKSPQELERLIDGYLFSPQLNERMYSDR